MMSPFTHDGAAFKTPVAGQPTFFLLGPVVQFLATPEQTTEQFTVLRSTVAPGVVVPLHSHRETEWLFVLEGAIQVWADRQEQPQWIEITAQESVLIPPQARHVIRNTSGTPAFVLLVAAARIGHLFEQIATPLAPGEPFSLLPTPELIQRFLAKQAEYGYWSASPEENAAIGIHLETL